MPVLLSTSHPRQDVDVLLLLVAYSSNDCIRIARMLKQLQTGLRITPVTCSIAPTPNCNHRRKLLLCTQFSTYVSRGSNLFRYCRFVSLGRVLLSADIHFSGTTPLSNYETGTSKTGIMCWRAAWKLGESLHLHSVQLSPVDYLGNNPVYSTTEAQSSRCNFTGGVAQTR